LRPGPIPPAATESADRSTCARSQYAHVRIPAGRHTRAKSRGCSRTLPPRPGRRPPCAFRGPRSMFTTHRTRGAQSRRRPAARLRFDTFEDRVVPTISIGVNADSLGSNAIPALGNSGAVGPDHFVQFESGNFVVFDKAGNPVVSEPDSTFWNNAGLSFTLM